MVYPDLVIPRKLPVRAVSQVYTPSLMISSKQIGLLRGFGSIPILIDVVAITLRVIGLLNNPTVLITPDSESYMLIQGYSSETVVPTKVAISLSTKF